MSKKPTKAAGAENGEYRTYFMAWRKHRRLTQHQLAIIVGTNKTRITLKERDLESWDKDYIERLSKALEVDIWSLLYQDPNNPSRIKDVEACDLFASLSEEAQAKAIDYMKMLKLADLAHAPPPGRADVS